MNFLTQFLTRTAFALVLVAVVTVAWLLTQR